MIAHLDKALNKNIWNMHEHQVVLFLAFAGTDREECSQDQRQ